jgi:hypothetical protein
MVHLGVKHGRQPKKKKTQTESSLPTPNNEPSQARSTPAHAALHGEEDHDNVSLRNAEMTDDYGINTSDLMSSHMGLLMPASIPQQTPPTNVILVDRRGPLQEPNLHSLYVMSP